MLEGKNSQLSSPNQVPIKFSLPLRHRILEATTNPRTRTTKPTKPNMPETVTFLMEIKRRQSAESMKAADKTNTTSDSTASGETASTTVETSTSTSNDQSSSSDAQQDQNSTPSETKKD